MTTEQQSPMASQERALKSTSGISEIHGDQQALATEDALPASNVPSTTSQRQHERLDRLGLKPGASSVYRIMGKIYAWGDFTHCPAEDISHNIKVLASSLRSEPSLWAIGKSFGADLYRVEKAGDWERVKREVSNIYKEKLYLVAEDGSVTVAEDVLTMPEQLPEESHQSQQPLSERLERTNAMEHKNVTDNHKNGHTPPPSNGHMPNGVLDILWDGLPPAVVEKLAKPLDQALVSYRKGRRGRTFSYLEGHTAIDQANRVFGYGGWGYELVGEVTSREVKSVDERTGEVSTSQMYFATVKVTVPGVASRTDVGCQAVVEDNADGHDSAYKGAVTDALKRALRSFGDQFGNGLYGDEHEAIPDETRGDELTPTLRDTLLQLGRSQGLSDAQMLEAVRKRAGKPLDNLSASEVAGLIQAIARKKTAPAPSSPTVNPSVNTAPSTSAPHRNGSSTRK